MRFFAGSGETVHEGEVVMATPHIWVLVADGKTARVFSAQGRTSRFEPAIPFEMRLPNPSTREQGTDKPGRVFESQGGTRHSVEPRVDLHREAKRTFAEEIAALLKEKTREKAFDELLLIAPPQMMGDLRAALDGPTRARVKGEVVKDLTKLSPSELHDYLVAEVWS